MNRRDFLQTMAALAGAGAVVPGCGSEKPIGGRIIGASAAIGHLLRDGAFGQPESVSEHEVVILGAGVSGLSAARQLSRRGISDLLVLELEDHAGGNASFGSNAVSAFPWGAHYVPVPNNSLTEYLGFLEECGVITGYDAAGLPLYNEFHLCFDPQERLFINGQWQDGLVPKFGVPEGDRDQIRRFLATMDNFSTSKGSDGKDAFAIPVNDSSADPQFTGLDRFTMKTWLEREGYTSSYLHWYVDYCCRDDYGTLLGAVSAWAGIHYFASRKGRGGNAGRHDVLTWPEGNGFLVKALQQGIGDKIQTGALAVEVAVEGDGVRTTFFDVKEKKLKAVRSRYCIMALPQFVAARLLRDEKRQESVHRHLHYTPWMVANFTVGPLPEKSGTPLSWDNVLYGSPSLGFVHATHESIGQRLDRRNYTYYLPLTGNEAAAERKAALLRSHADWVELILQDLKPIYPELRTSVEAVDLVVWGHAMAQPLPEWIHGNERRALSATVGERIHFAHTDLAGVSIFEEAFYQGLRAAEGVVSSGY